MTWLRKRCAVCRHFRWCGRVIQGSGRSSVWLCDACESVDWHAINDPEDFE